MGVFVMVMEWGVWLVATLVFAVVFIVLRQRLVLDPSRRRKHLAGIVVLAAIGGTLELVRGLGFSPALVWFGTRKGLGTHGASGDRTDLVRLATTKDGGLLCWKHRCWSDFAV